MKKYNDLPNHAALIYQWDDPIWEVPLSVDEAKRVLYAVVGQAVRDEQQRGHANLKMTAAEDMAHDWYIHNPGGMREDCEHIGFCYESVMKVLNND